MTDPGCPALVGAENGSADPVTDEDPTPYLAFAGTVCYWVSDDCQLDAADRLDRIRQAVDELYRATGDEGVAA